VLEVQPVDLADMVPTVQGQVADLSILAVQEVIFISEILLFSKYIFLNQSVFLYKHEFLKINIIAIMTSLDPLSSTFEWLFQVGTFLSSQIICFIFIVPLILYSLNTSTCIYYIVCIILAFLVQNLINLFDTLAH
jgi:hypothetical protein